MEESQKKSKSGRKPKYDYQSKEFLSLVESYAKKGFTDKERSRKTRHLHTQSLRYTMVAEPSLRCLERSKVVLVPDALKKFINDITFAVL